MFNNFIIVIINVNSYCMGGGYQQLLVNTCSMNWVHCNVCYLQPPGKNAVFALTSCGHIICGGCMPCSSGTANCKVCDRSCSTVSLSKEVGIYIYIYIFFFF